MYEQHLSDLFWNEKRHARALFKALQQLNPEQREILADKYYHSDRKANYEASLGRYTTVIPNVDKDIAKKYGISYQKYRKLRTTAEGICGSLYRKALEQYDNKDMDNLDEFVYKLSEYYVKEDDLANLDEILLTTDLKKAKVYRKNDELLLKTFHFKKAMPYQDRRLLELERID